VTDNKTEVVVLGPAGGNPHGMDEYVDLDTFFDLIKIMVLTAIDYCGTE
jgi:acetylornithine deacetylase/succinyl-diaminopimelate desuccinylase-like protein